MPFKFSKRNQNTLFSVKQEQNEGHLVIFQDERTLQVLTPQFYGPHKERS
jgi:hypothetical protein